MLTILLFIDCSKMARIRINTRNNTKEKPYLINSYFFKIGKAKKKEKKSIGWAKYVYLCEWDTCWRNFCNFPWWLKNVKNSPFFKWAPFWNLIPKKKTLTSFWNKLPKLLKKDPILHVATLFSLKQGETRTSHGPIPHPLTKQLRWRNSVSNSELHFSRFIVNEIKLVTKENIKFIE